ncbi:MAG TPA: copper homeostasis periplasmic binding protein CopC [Lichenihabitans sp.]|nr:copper homeostasis periplasmic binding protein CopC [Lichenihabitans sp.]
MTTLTHTSGLAALCFIALTGQAFAHAHLKSATPPMGETVAAAPSELDLMFSEGLNLKFTGVKVTGPGKKAVATGDASLGAGGDTTLVVPVSAPLSAGTYTVSWHALSTDGHKTSGSYKFTVKP